MLKHSCSVVKRSKVRLQNRPEAITFRKIMESFTIKDVENLSGIKAHTIRVWEQRYQIVNPKRRNEGLHREYTNDELKHLLRIAFLYHNGFKISSIAKLTPEALKELTFSHIMERPVHDKYIQWLLEAMMLFNESLFESVLDQAFENLGTVQAMDYVVYPYLQRVGMLWLTDNTMPAQEHFASNLIRKKIIICINQLPKYTHQATQSLTLLITPENEYHEIPLLYIHYLMKKAGNACLYAGASVPLSVVDSICKSRHISHVHFHVITNFTDGTIDDYLHQLARTCRKQKIVMSGPLTERVTIQPSNVLMLNSFEQAVSYVTQQV